jgi:hypothetical protein
MIMSVLKAVMKVVVIGNILFLLTGYEGNSKFIDPEIPTIARGEAEGNSWYRDFNKLTIPRISS